MVESIVMQFGSDDFPIHEVLGPRTRKVLESAHSGHAAIIRDRMAGDFAGATVLAGPRPLSQPHIAMIKSATGNPRAYYNGRPIFRRLPARQNFAIQLTGDNDTLDLMLDLQNPGWGFYCGEERYQDWHWCGESFKDIAKELFPEYASKSGKAMWRAGAIKELEDALER